MYLDSNHSNPISLLSLSQPGATLSVCPSVCLSCWVVSVSRVPVCLLDMWSSVIMCVCVYLISGGWRVCFSGFRRCLWIICTTTVSVCLSVRLVWCLRYVVVHWGSEKKRSIFFCNGSAYYWQNEPVTEYTHENCDSRSNMRSSSLKLPVWMDVRTNDRTK